jgi:glucosamine--fructose-6-phosphate aminotransferase (isomerizing)
MYTYQEILSQGSTWAATLQDIDHLSEGTLYRLQETYQTAIFTGAGSTYYLSRAAAGIWQALTGQTARGVPASELWLFPGLYLTGQASLLVAVSRSAETTETLRAIHGYQEKTGRQPVVITCYPDREMARDTPFVLASPAAQEGSMAQTRSFTSMLLMAQTAASVAARREDYRAELQLLPGAFTRLVADYEPLARKLAGDPQHEQFIFLGSGTVYHLACEAMLKMKEMSLSPSEAFHFLEFRHGPKAVVTPRTLIIGLVSDTARDEERRVLAEMRGLGATVFALAEEAGGLEADEVIELHSGVGELARGALYLPILQLMAYYRAMNKGLDPDRPKNLDAVVRL